MNKFLLASLGLAITLSGVTFDVAAGWSSWFKKSATPAVVASTSSAATTVVSDTTTTTLVVDAPVAEPTVAPVNVFELEQKLMQFGVKYILISKLNTEQKQELLSKFQKSEQIRLGYEQAELAKEQAELAQQAVLLAEKQQDQKQVTTARKALVGAVIGVACVAGLVAARQKGYTFSDLKPVLDSAREVTSGWLDYVKSFRSNAVITPSVGLNPSYCLVN